MQVFNGLSQLLSPPTKAVVTIGNFDGVHRGHQEIFRLVNAHARRIQGTAIAISFRPHPQVILNPERAPLLLNTYDEKRDLLAKTGVDWMVEEPFSREFSETTPEQFVDRVLVEKLKVQSLYLGHDFAFGRGRAGSVAMLQALGRQRGIEIHVVPAIEFEGAVVSSSQIRKLLESGELEKVNKFLGRSFFVRGLVWRGQGRGRTIGFPTANLQLEKRQLPKIGVYVSRVRWKGQYLAALTNVGRNPTFTGTDDVAPVVVETHILDFSETIYGDTLEVEFFHFLRPEKKFSGADELVVQIKQDCVLARDWHKSHPRNI